jgi:hypothetical protein
VTAGFFVQCYGISQQHLSVPGGLQGDFTGLLQSLNPLGETEKKVTKVCNLHCCPQEGRHHHEPFDLEWPRQFIFTESLPV